MIDFTLKGDVLIINLRLNFLLKKLFVVEVSQFCRPF